MSDNDDIRVQLARIEGKQDVTNAHLSNVQSDIADIRQVQYRHGDRLGILEADRNVRTGERQGLALGGRIIWTIIGAVPVGAVALALKLFGV
jgi:hypothetical protein